MTRVLFIQPFAGKGGSENVLLRVLRELSDGYEATALLMDRGPLADEIEEIGVPVLTEPLPGKRSVPRFPRAARALAADPRFRDFDVIHANGTKAGLFAASLGPRLGVPSVFMKHGHDYDWWAPKYVGARSDRIVCVSRAVADTFPAEQQDKVSVIYPGVPLPEAVPAGGTPPQVISVGRLDPKKGIDTLVEAMAVLRDRGVDGELRIVGPVNPKSPRFGEKLERLIAKLGVGDRVSIAGWVDDLDAAYRGARVVAMASRTAFLSSGPAEGTPLALLEGMSHARPVVAPFEQGISEIVGDAGTLVPETNSVEIAAALAPFLEDAALAERVGATGRERVETSFSVEVLTRSLEAVYDEVSVTRPEPAVAGERSEPPRVAVLIPCFNDAEYVSGAVASVGDSEDFEVIVIDDASTDQSTIAELARLEAEGLRVVRQDRNQGPGPTRMTGVAETTAPYIVPLDSDDLAEPASLIAMADILDSDPHTEIVYGDYLEFGDGHRLVRAVPEKLDPYRLTYTNEYPACSMIRRKTLVALGGWTSEEIHEDWDLWMSVAERGIAVRHLGVGEITYRRRVHTGRRGALNRTRHREVYRRLKERHPKLFSSRRDNARASDMGRVRKSLYRVVYGGRRRFPGETLIKNALDRAGVWTLRR